MSAVLRVYEEQFINIVIIDGNVPAMPYVIPPPGTGKTIVIDQIIFSSNELAGKCSLVFYSGYVTTVLGPLYWKSLDIFVLSGSFLCNPEEPFRYGLVMENPSGSFSLNVRYHIRG